MTRTMMAGTMMTGTTLKTSGTASTPASTPTTKPTTKTAEPHGHIAAVLVRGPARIEQSILDTLMMLRLNQKNHCVVLHLSPSLSGMLQKVKDFITWGEITAETFDELVQKRGVAYKGRLMDRQKKYSYKVMDYKGKKYLPYFSLNPPLKGFGRKGVKMAYAAGGALGYRGEKMNDLIKRML